MEGTIIRGNNVTFEGVDKSFPFGSMSLKQIRDANNLPRSVNVPINTIPVLRFTDTVNITSNTPNNLNKSYKTNVSSSVLHNVPHNEKKFTSTDNFDSLDQTKLNPSKKKENPKIFKYFTKSSSNYIVKFNLRINKFELMFVKDKEDISPPSETKEILMDNIKKQQKEYSSNFEKHYNQEIQQKIQQKIQGNLLGKEYLKGIITEPSDAEELDNILNYRNIIREIIVEIENEFKKLLKLSTITDIKNFIETINLQITNDMIKILKDIIVKLIQRHNILSRSSNILNQRENEYIINKCYLEHNIIRTPMEESICKKLRQDMNTLSFIKIKKDIIKEILTTQLSKLKSLINNDSLYIEFFNNNNINNILLPPILGKGNRINYILFFIILIIIIIIILIIFIVYNCTNMNNFYYTQFKNA
jgi:hypothetical protein